ncbi:CRISPR-associated endonuclease Cas1 [Aurantimonas sp. VKM B-3413]|uniref:CRISPR-associated endonuclease Cas1 n=1 Tax=Aurantimonas sp. VKM B-3413 TaxID=2779401 RepID=UPI00351D14FF
MKKLLNTLYVTTEGASLKKDGENAVVSVEGEERARVPFHMLTSIVLFGPILVSPAVIGAAAAQGMAIVLLDRVGRFQARIEGPVSGNVLLRRAQYAASEAPDEIVRGVVLGKVSNQRQVLMRALRDHGAEMAGRDAVEAATVRLAHILRRVELAGEGTDASRGAEGEAAAVYFAVFDQMIRVSEPDAVFRSLAPAAARPGQRVVVVSLHAPDA